MKTLFSSLAASLMMIGSALAQDLVTAGTITAYAPDTGMLTLQPDSRVGHPLVFQQMNTARVMMASGATMPAADLRAGQQVTVHYAKAGDRWTLSKIVVAEPLAVRPGTPPVAPALNNLPAGERRALETRAPADRDITTQPGSKASIDRDITTQPGSKAAADRDITTQPGSKAAADRDITTQPGSTR
jgi:hypothetical protein